MTSYICFICDQRVDSNIFTHMETKHKKTIVENKDFMILEEKRK